MRHDASRLPQEPKKKKKRTAQKKKTSQTDEYLVILSSKTYFLKTNWLSIGQFD